MTSTLRDAASRQLRLHNETIAARGKHVDRRQVLALHDKLAVLYDGTTHYAPGALSGPDAHTFRPADLRSRYNHGYRDGLRHAVNALVRLLDDQTKQEGNPAK